MAYVNIFSFSWTGTYDEALHALNLAAEAGLKVVFMCPELKSQPEETVRKVKNHPGLGMYYLRDEPKDDDLEPLGEWARRIESEDSTHPCYMNLLPCTPFTPEAYERHLRLFTEKVNLPQLSFDHYPIFVEEDRVCLRPDFYRNLEMIRAEALRVGKPFWAFALTTAHHASKDYPVPTIHHLRLQVYSNLAYGAQLLQYFTYWNPQPGHMNFRQAPMSRDGHRSSIYELVRELNQEIQLRAFVWAGCQVERVTHLGDSIPLSTKPFTSLPAHFHQIQNEWGHGLISEIRNGKHRYVMLVNTSPVEEWRVRVETDEEVQIICREATTAPASLYDPLFILSPGDCTIFEIPPEPFSNNKK